MPEKLGSINVKNQIQFKPLGGGQTEVSFVADNLTYAEKIKLKTALETAGDMLTITIGKFRKKRSLNSNSYLWVLLQMLAEERGQTKEEVYREFIKGYGVFKPATVNTEAASTLVYIWEHNGIGWVAEEVKKNKNTVDLLLYYGSSTYSNKQMARLLDAVINDCKQCGIETLPPEQIEEMKRTWERERKP